MTPKTVRAERSRQQSVLPPVFVMSDSTKGGDPLDVANTIPRHWGYILRHYNHPGRQSLAHALVKICRRRRIILVIAGDWCLASKVGADGIHMPEGLMRNRPASPYLLHYRDKIITTSAHDAKGLRHAGRFPISAVFLSPVYRTSSHPRTEPIGILSFSALTSSCLKPVYALGGVKLRQGRQLRAMGASGIAGISLAEKRDNRET